MLRTHQVQSRPARLVKNDYMIYIKEEQQYNSVTKMISELRWKGLADRRRSEHLPLSHEIVNREVNVLSEGIIIPMKGE